VRGNEVNEVVAAAFALPHSVTAIVAIGGGVAVDVGKYAGFLARLPMIAVPTAISNDGFCSPGASLSIGGRRISCPSTIPFGVVVDTEVINNSPRRFTYSGIGDLVSKFSAVADWKIAYHETGEPINDFSVMISMQSVENLVNHPDKSLDDLPFLQLVCGALVMNGVAMEVAGSSRPASGSEHLISHAYEQLAPATSLHGLQVGVATLATTWLQDNPAHATVRRVFEETGFAAYVGDNRLDRAAFVEAVGRAPTVKPDHYTVLSRPGARERLQAHLATDPFWDTYLA
jgi:glycerol-1-phosphate dehydrogenase [NAD(P)+]